MPTGYTAPIKDGISFEQYAWGCARAFGALVLMRDDPSDTPIPERFEPSQNYQQWADELAKEIARLEAMTPDEAEHAASQAFHEAMTAYENRIAERTELLNKYNAMLAQVVKWQPPTPEHVKYKEFMASQIRESIDHDCDSSYDNPPEAIDGKTWREKRLEETRRMHEVYVEGQKEENARTENRNAWIKALRESLA